MEANRVAAGRVVGAATALVLALTLAGCSGDEEATPGPATPAASMAEPGERPRFSVEPVTTSGRLVGRLPRRDRRTVESSVAGVALQWLDAAYLGGRYPRRGFRNSFGVFTPAARAAARDDLDRMTNARIGDRVERVTPTRMRVRVDLLAVGGRAVTSTAHVDARFRTAGRLSRTYRVAGRLMLTRQDRRWRVFAYDVARGRVDARRSSDGPLRRDGRASRDRGGRA